MICQSEYLKTCPPEYRMFRANAQMEEKSADCQQRRFGIIRNKVMTKYYLTKIIYNGLTYFFIWYSNDEDGFLLFNQRLLVFSSVEEANIFADKEHIIFEKGITVFYLSKITELIDNVEISQNCQSLIDTWHLFSDLSKSLK